ncbi:MAG: TRAP transporter substrate-binding protein, partial [Spirochaetaceae bacterium]|nr:TRAP transporter substrate-binding protein [Spirochaetaceae bacterium]
MKRCAYFVFFAVLAVAIAMPAFAGGGGESGGAAPSKITIVGGTMLPEGHVYHRTVQKFEERMKVNYKGPVTIEFSIHHSGTLGTEKDSVEFMIQGTAVDTYVVSPSWIATWDRTTPIIDAPFVFRDVDHWRAAVAQKAFQPIEDLMISKGLRIIGYGGGSARHLISKVPANSVADFPKIKLRVQGSPVHQKAFSAAGFMATPLDYMEVYNAIKTGVLDALENEPAGLQSMK